MNVLCVCVCVCVCVVCWATRSLARSLTHSLDLIRSSRLQTQLSLSSLNQSTTTNNERTNIEQRTTNEHEDTKRRRAKGEGRRAKAEESGEKLVVYGRCGIPMQVCFGTQYQCTVLHGLGIPEKMRRCSNQLVTCPTICFVRPRQTHPQSSLQSAVSRQRQATGSTNELAATEGRCMLWHEARKAVE